MKKTIFTFLSALILFVFVNQTFAQVPQGFNYQAVARNSIGALLTNQALGVKLSIHQGSATGTVVYSERQTPTTNTFGLFTVTVGQGTWLSGTFNTINWSSGSFWLQVELDVSGGATYTDMGTSQLLTVPYAMYADKVGTSGYTETDPIFLVHPAHGITPTNIINWNAAYGWGNHAGLYRPISWVPAWTDITGKPTTLAGYGITDAMSTSHVANGITATNINNWNTAFGWGNHAGLYRPVSWVPAWGDVTGKPTFATVATSGSYNDLINKLTAGTGIQINGSNVISANLTLSVSNTGDTLRLNPGNFVIVPSISSVNASQPQVITSIITTITSSSANCGYTVNMVGLPAITIRGICYGTNHLPDIGGLHTTDGAGTGTFTANMTGLSPNTVYYVRAYATNTNGTYYGAELLFTSTATLPTVTTADTTIVGTSTATCGGNVTDNGGANVTTRGVCWATSQNPTISNSKTVDGTGNGIFTSNMTGLANNTLYYYRGYATNSVGTGYGTQKSFTTDCAPPSVITDTVLSSGCNSAVVNCHIPSAGCVSVTERGICYGTSHNPTIWSKKIASGSGIGSYSVPIPILVPNTTYYVRSYATTSNGTTYSSSEKSINVPASYYAGFESGIPSDWTGMWSVSTDSPYEGAYCLKSSNANDSIKFTRTVTVASQISFFHRRDGFYSPTMSFYIDNVLQGTIGTEGWTIHTYPIPAGTHTFKWKNNDGDPRYIDYVIICP